MRNTPVTLLERLRQPTGQEAWQRFVLLYTPLLYHWAYRVGARGQDAEDLVQDVFLLLVRKLPEFTCEADKSFHGWLRTVVLPQWCARRRRSKPARPVDTVPPEEIGHPDPTGALGEAAYRPRNPPGTTSGSPRTRRAAKSRWKTLVPH
jgi:RNA polymerase sigma-70 factor (ECF subfamily)